MPTLKSYVGHNVPAGQYGTVTKEENGTFSPIRNPKSSGNRHFPSGYSDPSDPRKRRRRRRDIPEGIGEGYSKIF